MTEPHPPTVEVSGHYLGDKAKEYFQYQSKGAVVGGVINAERFSVFVKPTDTVLDFGCGVGGILHNLQVAKKLGVEPNPISREFCNSHTSIYTVASITEIPDDSVDVVMTNHCLEHVPYPLAALREMHRVLKPGGKFIAYLPIDDWRTQRSYDNTDINHHLHTWTPLLFGHTLQEAGFTKIRTKVDVHAFPRGFAHIYPNVPRFVFNIWATLTAIYRKRRQLLALAEKPERPPAAA